MIDSPVELKGQQMVVISIRVAQTIKGVMLSRVVYILPATADGKPTRYGVQFEQIDFDVKRQIRNFVASNNAEIAEALKDVV